MVRRLAGVRIAMSRRDNSRSDKLVQRTPARIGSPAVNFASPPSPHFLNSTFVNCPARRGLAGGPTLEIHSADAADRGIADGQPVRIINDRGSFQALAVVGESVRPGVVLALGIWWNKLTPDRNANQTTSSGLADIGGGAVFFDNLVQVQSCRDLYSADVCTTIQYGTALVEKTR